MTINSETMRVSYAGNGVQTEFPYTFKILDEDHIEVYLDTTLQAITTDYTVDGVGMDAGGNVTFLEAPDSDVVVLIIRQVPFTQTTDYLEGDEFAEEAHEDALDKLTMQTQQLDEQLSRAALLAKTSTLSDLTLPEGVGQVIGWDGVGTALRVYDFVSSDTLSPMLDADNYADFATAIASIGASNVTLRVSSAQTISSNVTVPENIDVWAIKGGSFAIDAGYTLTINGSFKAGNYQIKSGSGSLVFGDGAVEEANILWFGADRTKVADSSSAIQQALDAYPWVYCPGGDYQWDATVFIDELEMYEINYRLRGQGKQTIFWPTTSLDLDGDERWMLRHNQLRNLDYTSEDQPTGTITFTADAGTDLATVASHNLATGHRLYVTSTGTLPAPLEAGELYYAIIISDTTLQFADTYAEAMVGTYINLTTAGSGTHSLEWNSQASAAPSQPRFILQDFVLDGSDASHASFMISERSGFITREVAAYGMLREFKTVGYCDSVQVYGTKRRDPVYVTYGPYNTVSFDAASSELRDSTNGDFVNDGFVVGMSLLVMGSSNHNYVWKITGVTATALTLEVDRGSAYDVMDEAAGSDISLQAGGFFLDLNQLGDGLVFQGNNNRNYPDLYVNLVKCRGGILSSNINGTYIFHFCRAVEFFANHIENNYDPGSGYPHACQIRSSDVRVVNNSFNIHYDPERGDNVKQSPILVKDDFSVPKAFTNASILDNSFYWASQLNQYDPADDPEYTEYADPIRIETWYKNEIGTAQTSTSVMRLLGNACYMTEQGATSEAVLGITIDPADTCGASSTLGQKKYYLSAQTEVALTYVLTTHRLLGAEEANLIRFVGEAPAMTAAQDTSTSGKISDSTTYYYTCCILTERGMGPQSHADGAFDDAAVSAPDDDGSILLLPRTPPNSYIRIWRSTTANDANIDRYIDLPCFTGRTMIWDFGDYIMGRPWLTSSIPARPGTTDNTGSYLMLKIDDGGTATTDPSDTVLTDTNATYVTDALIGHNIVFTSGTADGNSYLITDNAATTVTAGAGTMYTDGARSGDSYVIGDATPSIRRDRFFLCQKNGAITDLDDGYPSQMVTLIADGYSSIADGGNFVLEGAWGPDDGDVITLFHDGLYWREISRVDVSV